MLRSLFLSSVSFSLNEIINTNMLNKITNDIINNCIKELSSEKNKEKINNYIIAPLIHTISNKLHPYLVTMFVMYILILILVISIMLILIMNKNNIK